MHCGKASVALILSGLAVWTQALSMPSGLKAISWLGIKRQINTQRCPQAAPGVNATRVFAAACNQNPQNNVENCMDRLWNYANSSIDLTCQFFYNRYQACTSVHDNDQAACTQDHDLWDACGDYTLQAYAYCGCYYNLPNDVSNCANVQLGIEEQAEIQSSTTFSGGVTSIGTNPSTTSAPSSASITPGPATLSGMPTTTITGPTFTPSFVPTGTLATTPFLPPSSAAVTTVSTFTISLPTEATIATPCGAGPSTSLCTTTGTLPLHLNGQSPLVTGFVCQGGDCLDQKPGYEYCRRIMNSAIVSSH